ncbi:hypothetical protein [Pararhizobium haloflavum]|uniref:hypothetical protein n=1 Tax=Pararhizobium haloflavum TaxID=2037914 RepID=UPI000C17C15F|nr:hypothetical protein [Pararhizobium haloflavum]
MGGTFKGRGLVLVATSPVQRDRPRPNLYLGPRIALGPCADAVARAQVEHHAQDMAARGRCERSIPALHSDKSLSGVLAAEVARAFSLTGAGR